MTDHARQARIEPHAGWWYRYAVHRTIGIGIPENNTSLHRTKAKAERAKRRWEHIGTTTHDHGNW